MSFQCRLIVEPSAHTQQVYFVNVHIDSHSECLRPGVSSCCQPAWCRLDPGDSSWWSSRQETFELNAPQMLRVCGVGILPWSCRGKSVQNVPVNPSSEMMPIHHRNFPSCIFSSSANLLTSILLCLPAAYSIFTLRHIFNLKKSPHRALPVFPYICLNNSLVCSDLWTGVNGLRITFLHWFETWSAAGDVIIYYL